MGILGEETPTGRTKVLVLHAASITLTNYQPATAQPGPGLTLRLDITLPQLSLDIVEAKQTLIVSPNATFHCALLAHSRLVMR
ncbi:hypothetical protein [Streptomyces sp. NPDC002156]